MISQELQIIIFPDDYFYIRRVGRVSNQTNQRDASITHVVVEYDNFNFRG